MKVAVIAVHGVADQQPEDTANTAANLLLHLDPGEGHARYPGFRTHRLRVPLRGVRLSSNRLNAGSDSEKCQHEFLRGQLDHYQEPDPAATYQTIRNEGIRRGENPGEDREVHVYEMYWADLSRLGNSFLTFFVELYQLLFHLCTVGAKTARFAANHHRGAWTWQAFYRCIQGASHFIRLPIPIGNLFVLALVALAGAAEIPTDAPRTRACIVAILCASLAVGSAFLLRRIVPGTGWPYTLLAVAAIGGLAWLIIQGRLLNHQPLFANRDSLLRLVYFEAWALLLLLLWKILKAYNERHPHALLWGGGIAAITSILLFRAVQANTDIIPVCQDVGGRLLRGLGITWALVVLLAFLGWIFGAAAVFFQTTRDARPSGRRAVYTANLVIALTGFVMLVINIALWGFLAKGMEKALASTDLEALKTIAHSIQDHLAQVTIIPGMATLLILMALGTAWALWSLIPAVRSEMQTPAPQTNSSRWIGRSLTTAFRAMTLSGLVAIASFSFLFLVAIILNIKPDHNPINVLMDWDQKGAVRVFGSFSWLILLFLVAPFFLKGFFVKISAGLRQGLDIALDVINYLREHPRDSTIRAQIFARYVSLLRYVCNWKSPINTGGYDRIIIFAHSQGTIITVDLLRFLKVEPDPDLQFLATPGRIRLFTMGCPLRQLYGLRFPHLYDWARHHGTLREKGAPLPDDRPPDPTKLLSLQDWTNAYRSGDYVGRNIWRSESDPDVYDVNEISQDTGGTRREFCIGGGAHIHYWDKTARRIAEELDRLIANA